MRVALVVAGGVDRSARDRIIPALLWLIDRLAARHDMTVYALRYHKQPTEYRLLGATVRDLGSPAGIARQVLALTTRLRTDGPFDVLHGYWAMPAGLAAVAAGRLVRVPALVTLDSGELTAIPPIGYGLQRSVRHRLAVKATLRAAARLTVCSQYMATLAHPHGVRPDVVPLGVDAGLFAPAARPEGPPWRLVHVASLNPVKDQTTLVSAVGRLIDRGLDVHLDVAGEDTRGGLVQRAARAAGLEGRITFHGLQTSAALVPLYQRAHLHLLSSLHEAAGVAVLEAAACGVPTVGTAVGYVADWSPDRAVAVPPGDPAALADAAALLLADPARRARLARAAREWTLAHDADWTAARFDEIYSSLTRSGSFPPRAA